MRSLPVQSYICDRNTDRLQLFQQIRNTLPPNGSFKDWSEQVLAQPHHLMADVGPALEWQVFDVPHGQQNANSHHHNDAEHFGRRMEISKRITCLARLFQLATRPDSGPLPDSTASRARTEPNSFKRLSSVGRLFAFEARRTLLVECTNSLNPILGRDQLFVSVQFDLHCAIKIDIGS